MEYLLFIFKYRSGRHNLSGTITIQNHASLKTNDVRVVSDSKSKISLAKIISPDGINFLVFEIINLSRLRLYNF